jgi:hypothetical protein
MPDWIRTGGDRLGRPRSVRAARPPRPSLPSLEDEPGAPVLDSADCSQAAALAHAAEVVPSRTRRRARRSGKPPAAGPGQATPSTLQLGVSVGGLCSPGSAATPIWPNLEPTYGRDPGLAAAADASTRASSGYTSPPGGCSSGTARGSIGVRTGIRTGVVHLKGSGVWWR